MSTLLAHPPVIERRPAAEPRPAPASEPAPSAPPPLSGPGGSVTAIGSTKTDIRILIAVYVLVVLLGTFVCLAFRFGHAEAWAWGVHLINVPLAAAGAGLLVLATIAAGAALHCARNARRRLTTGALGITMLCCLGFLATLAIDVEAKWAYGIRPAEQFRPNERYVARRFGVKLPRTRPGAAAVAPLSAAKPLVRLVDATHGRKLFLGTCMSCHGVRGEGLPGQGKSLIANEFIGQLDDVKLLDFLKVGRQPWDPLNTTRVQMPPRGGNPMLSDDDLRDVVAYVRTLQAPPAEAAPGDRAGVSPDDPGAGATKSPLPAEELDPTLLLPRWVVTSPPIGQAGLAPDYVAEITRPDWKPPRDGVAFVNGYYAATQFGGLQAGALAIAFGALLVQTLRRRMSAANRLPFMMGFVGCLVLTATWLIVFPFTYLA